MKTEHEVMARLRLGDERALDEMIDLHWDRLVRYGYRLLGDWDRAEDVTQGAFVRLWARRDRWVGESEIALLYRIVRNASYDVLKAPSERSEPQLVDTLVDPDDPEAAAAVEELQRAATRAVSSLPAKRREVFVLSREHGLSYNEIAELMGLSRQTVANHMSLALSDLRVLLQPFLSDASSRSTPDDEARQAEPGS